MSSDSWCSRSSATWPRGPVHYLDVGITGVVALGFTAFVAKFGTRIARRVIPRLNANLSVAESEFTLAMTLLFGLSVLAVYAGVAAIIGAFLAGMALSETCDRRVHEFTNGVSELLVPFFLAGIGLHFDTSAFGNPVHSDARRPDLRWPRSSPSSSAAVSAHWGWAARTPSASESAWCRGAKSAWSSRRSVLRMGVMAESVYGIIVFMSVATTLIAPPLLKLTFRGVRPLRRTENMVRLG